MASQQKIHANRNNARASPAPRTARGKATASRNAKKHGLSLSVLVDPSFLADLYYLGRNIAGKDARAELMEPACRIAAAQLDLARIRQVRNVLLSEAEAILLGNNAVKDPDAKPAHSIEEVIRQLTPLDRYERRTLSRRKRRSESLMRRNVSWREILPATSQRPIQAFGALAKRTQMDKSANKSFGQTKPNRPFQTGRQIADQLTLDQRHPLTFWPNEPKTWPPSNFDIGHPKWTHDQG